MNTLSANTVIEVQEIPPRERHATIFAAFRDLKAGDTLEIVNDHDPMPLYHQFEAQAPGAFSWDYLQNGPQVWRVSITKLAPSHASGGCCGHCGGGV